MRSDYSQPLFRPPSEAYSMIIQVTEGCSHNKCRFCYMYKGKQFRLKSKEEIKEHIGADSLHYLSLEGLIEATGSKAGYCKACLNGDYPMEVPNNGI